MSFAKRVLRTCVDCGTETYDRYFRGEKRGPADHGISGWESEQPLCVRCARIAIWGTPEPPPFGRKRKARL